MQHVINNINSYGEYLLVNYYGVLTVSRLIKSSTALSYYYYPNTHSNCRTVMVYITSNRQI
jgi:hypothetical protein